MIKETNLSHLLFKKQSTKNKLLLESKQIVLYNPFGKVDRKRETIIIFYPSKISGQNPQLTPQNRDGNKP